MKTAAEIARTAYARYVELSNSGALPLFQDIIREAIETDRTQIEKYLDAAEHPDEWGVTCVYTSRLRANLGLPQSVRDQDIYDEQGVLRNGK